MSSVDKNNIRGLGRGLDSLFGGDIGGFEKNDKEANLSIKEEVVRASEPFASKKEEVAEHIDDEKRIWNIPIEKLKINNFQPRKDFDKDKIKELSDSIKEQGVLQPIVARKSIKGDYEIIAGERRWRASQLAGLKEVPVILKDIDDQKSLELALIENIQRENLNPIEEAEAYERLAQEFHLTQQEISLKVGKERATVANTMRLLSLEKEVKRMLQAGDITAGHAKALLAIIDPDKQREIAKKIASERLTVRAAEKLIRSSKKPRETSPQDLSQEESLKTLNEEIQKKLGTKTKIDYHNGIGKISIYYYSETELTQIIDRIKNTWSQSNETLQA